MVERRGKSKLIRNDMKWKWGEMTVRRVYDRTNFVHGELTEND